MAEVRRFSGQDEFVQAAAAVVRRAGRKAETARGRFLLALSGGSTPEPVYRLLAETVMGAAWDKVHLFQGDERGVARDHEWSNWAMVRRALLVRPDIPQANLHPMDGAARPLAEAARAYEAEMDEVFAPGPGRLPRFDLVLLGLGPDGHTASLFPGSPALQARGWVTAAPAPGLEPNVDRLTLTLPVLGAARAVVFLVAGADKAAWAAKVAAMPPTPDVPATLVRPEGGAVWLICDA